MRTEKCIFCVKAYPCANCLIIYHSINVCEALQHWTIDSWVSNGTIVFYFKPDLVKLQYYAHARKVRHDFFNYISSVPLKICSWELVTLRNMILIGLRGLEVSESPKFISFLLHAWVLQPCCIMLIQWWCWIQPNA